MRHRLKAHHVLLAPHRLRTIILVALVSGGTAAALLELLNLWSDDNPRLVYWRYGTALDGYVSRLQAGRVAQNSDGQYAIPQFLIDRGARHIARDGNCFVITFGFMTTDAVPELWFSPSGFDPLPAGIAERKRHGYFQFRRLSAHWAECDWDD